MMVCTPMSTCTKNVVCLIGSVQRQMIVRVSDAFQKSSCHCFTFSNHQRLHYTTSKRDIACYSLTFKGVVNPRSYRKTRVNVSTGDQNMKLSLLMPKQSQASKLKCCVGPFSWRQSRFSSGVLIGLLLCYSTSQPAYAEAPEGKEKNEGCSQKKKVLTDYSVIGIPGDGRCLFRSVVHGACVQSGNPAPNEDTQRQLADELRAKVADELIKRREETEWFIEGDFDTYVSQIKKPHVWGGEPELLMASHVLKMPITVYMHDQDSNGLISISEYGQEYGKDSPIRVLYHGYGHYDALHVPGRGGARPRL